MSTVSKLKCGNICYVQVTDGRQYRQEHQYSETNVMHFLFNVLRIKGFYMFRALLTHPQEVLNKWHLVYGVRVMSVGCTRVGVELVSGTPIPLQSR
jgi:cytochrome b561